MLAFRHISDRQRDVLRNLFNIVYMMASSGKPVSDMEIQCELAQKLKVDIGPSYQNRFKAREFLHAMAECHRQDNTAIIKQAPFISILSDGSTDSSIMEQETVMVRAVHQGEPVTVLADIVSLDHAHAAGILQGIRQALGRVDTDLDDLASPDSPGPCLISCNFDGASVMMGCKSGVQARLKDIMGWDILAVHCVAHKLELGVLDAVKTLPTIINFELHIKWLYQFYSKFNAKNRRDVKQVAAVLEADFVNLPEIKEVRWLSSKARADEAVLKDVAVIATHLEEVATGDSEKAAKAKRLHKEVTSVNFLKQLHLMLDVLEVLGELSRFFQTDNLLVFEVQEGIDDCVMKLMDIKESGGCHMLDMIKNYSPGDKIFTSGNGSVNLTGPCPDVNFKDTSTAALLDGIISYVTSRFKDFVSNPLKAFSVFNYSVWPTSTSELASYGKADLQVILDTFARALSPQVQENAQKEFVTLKACMKGYSGKVAPLKAYQALILNPPPKLKSILQIVTLMLTVSCNTAQCERSFSAMNLVKTRQRMSMSQDILQDCLLLKTEGPSLTDYNPDRAINHWLSTGGSKHLANFKH